METTQNSLTDRAEKLSIELAKADKRKHIWRSEKKVFIEKILKSLTTGLQTSLKWDVQDGAVFGEEFVQLQLPNASVVNHPDNQKRGGRLSYILDHRGKILTVV